MKIEEWDFKNNAIRDHIKHIFSLDTWGADEASMYLAGASGVRAGDLGHYLLDGHLISSDSDHQEIIEKMSRYKQLWHSNPNNPEHATPDEFIHWAVMKKFPPLWLNEAINVGYYVEKMIESQQATNTNAPNIPEEKLVNPKSETAFLNIIGAMLGIMLEKSDGKGKRFSTLADQNALIEALHNNYGSTDGLSASNLEKKFAQAKKSISSK